MGKVHNPLSKPSPKKLIEAFNHIEQAFVILEAHDRYKLVGTPGVDMGLLREVHKQSLSVASHAHKAMEAASPIRKVKAQA